MNPILFWAREVLALLFFLFFLVFGLSGLLGLFRFPDPWSRLQASSVTSTTSVFSLLTALLLIAPSWAMASRILIIMAFFMISSPTGSHIIARFLWFSGLPHWMPEEKDKG